MINQSQCIIAYKRKNLTCKSMYKNYKDYRALKMFYPILLSYLKSQSSLSFYSVVKQISLLNVIMSNNNFVKLKINSKYAWMGFSDIYDHFMYFGTTGKGKSNFIPTTNPSSNTVLECINKNEQLGFELLPVMSNENYKVSLQYKNKTLFIILYFNHQDYFAVLKYHDQKLISYDSSFNQDINTISNNIAFLLAVDHINHNYHEILEQDISTEDKISLANMLNI